MSSRWTNKYAIMQDLSLAQGCGVPADLGATVAAGEKPPILNIMEETEEDYYQSGVNDDSENAGPDLSLIKHMLKMVQTVSFDSEEDNSIIQISKPVSKAVTGSKEVAKKSADCKKVQATENLNNKTNIVKKVRKKRENVAVNSILQGLLSIETIPITEPKPKTETIKLLKPTDFMLTSDIIKDSIETIRSRSVQSPQKEEYLPITQLTNDEENNCSQTNEYSAIVESVQKVNGWLDSNKSLDQNRNVLSWEPSSMFKKKSGSAAKSVQSDSVKSSPPQTINATATTTTMYQPSSLADEYYQKYMEQSKLKQFVNEDVWSKAEREMKEIDAKKKLHAEEKEAALIAHQLNEDCVTSYDAIRLPQHRHLLTGECVVCEMLKKNGIDINLALLHNTVLDDNILSMNQNIAMVHHNIQIGLQNVLCDGSPEEEPDKQNGETLRDGNVTYGIDDVPPWYLCIFMALQHYLTMIGAIVAIPFILCPALCMQETDPDRSNIISTMIFVTGLITWLQATFGCRLPIVQGGTISFLVPTLAILGLPAWECPKVDTLSAMTDAERRLVWTSRMCELSGAIAVAALLQMIFGFFGIFGQLLRFVTPLTIAPTVALVGLTLFDHAAAAAAQQWGVAAGTFILLTIFSQCMSEVKIPTLTWKRSTGCTITWFPLLKLFPVLLTIAIMWGVCGILTATGVFPPEHPARTDTKLNIIEDAPWFRVPYPGQWGAPTVSVAGVLGMLAGVLACTVESISYYPTTARMCAAPPPPLHAINRGLGVEGLGTVLAGLWGSGNGTNTFGENVGAIGVTKVGSRRVVQWAAGLMLLQGVVGKLCAVFIIIPQPVIGGLFCVMFGMISAFGLSALQYVDLNSSRNLYIIGFSLFFPLVLTRWMAANSGVINTGLEALDAVLQVLLSTSILVGGIVGCLLDNLIPGTAEERGLAAWAQQMSLAAAGATDGGDTYDFPVGMSYIHRWKWTSYLPFMPTYEAGKFTALFRKKES